MSFDPQFGEDVVRGLSATPKNLPSRYFYDEKGDRLFQEIMNMPEYYLTNCEYEIFQQQKVDILEAFDLESFDLVELGAGDGFKTKVLLSHFLHQGVSFRYIPIDISPFVLGQLEKSLTAELPGLVVEPLQGEYQKALQQLSAVSDRPKVVLFLGSSIGNFTLKDATRFLQSLRSTLNSGDELLIGFDLKKEPQVILDAYNDPAGITAAFNLNLLSRINRELQGNIQVEQFRHWETYHPITGEARSFLVSTRQQRAWLEAVQFEVRFSAWEAIQVELSQKYSPEEIEGLASASGFSLKRHFLDSKAYFIDSLWTA
jgi:L-histidine N-alpha-methyltransferase